MGRRAPHRANRPPAPRAGPRARAPTPRPPSQPKPPPAGFADPGYAYAGDAERRRAADAAVGDLIRGGPSVLPLARSTRPLPASWGAMEETLRAGGSLRGHLHPRPAAVPDVQGARRAGCALAASRAARRPLRRCLSRALAAPFEAVAAWRGPRPRRPGRGRRWVPDPATPAAAVPPVRLDRFDLWHGHLAWSEAHGRAVLLLHAREYPRRCPEGFPVALGRCQAGSGVEYSRAAMERRNFLYTWAGDGEGVVGCLDLRHGPTARALVHPGLAALGTTFEGDFGRVAGTVLYLKPRGAGKCRCTVLLEVP